MTASGREPGSQPDKTRSSDGGLAGLLRVFLLRHGDAGLRSAWTGDDAQRPLTTEGRKQVRLVAKRLTHLGVKPDVILTSPYARAVQTAAITAKVLGLEDGVAVEPALQPGFDVAELPPIVRAHAGAAALMLVGHEPPSRFAPLSTRWREGRDGPGCNQVTKATTSTVASALRT